MCKISWVFKMLNLNKGINNIFPHSKEFSQGLGKIRAGQATAVVSLDGSGDFDDIQEAIDSLPTEGGVVYIKEGNYVITEEIQINKDNVTISGTGRGTKISTSSNVTLFTTGNEAYTVSNDYIIIEKLFLKGITAPPNQHGIWVQSGSERITIRDCFIETMGAIGIVAAGGNNCMFINNYIYNCGSYGITYQNGDYGIIQGNICDDCFCGIVLNNTVYNSVLGNICNDNDDNGIELNGTVVRNAVIGNLCTGNADHGIKGVLSSTDHNVASGNVCAGNTIGQILWPGSTDNLPDGATGTTNLEIDDLNIIA